MPIAVEKTAYGGWSNCYQASNGLIELVITADVGPRVIRFGFPGGRNEFVEFPEDLGKTGGDEWRLYGGHRLWHAPEDRVRTYLPDNDPVAINITPDGLTAIQSVEARSGIRKSMTITLDANAPLVAVEQRLANEGLWPVEMAVWSLSVMAPGGTALAPHTDGLKPGLLPNRTVTLWPYTDLADDRLVWGTRLIRLRQREGKPPTKIGLPVPAGWCGYANDGHLFLKEFAYDEEALYPDAGAAVEIYTNERVLELETLGPLHLVEPGEEIRHTEIWSLHEGFTVENEDEQVIAAVEKLLSGK